MSILKTFEELVQKGDFHKALLFISQEIQKDKVNIDLYFERSKLFVKIAFYEEALEDIERCLKSNLKEEYLEIKIGVLKREKKFEELKKLRQVISDNKFDNLLKKFDENIEILETNPLCRITSDLDCSLCYKVFYQPITVHCGHSFCRDCLCRALDYTQKCPLCREPVLIRPEVHPITIVIDNLVQKYKEEEYKERKLEEVESRKLKTTNLPLFVLGCALYPSVPLSLHIFEPRYRLMIRRCSMGSQCFGLVPYVNNQIAEYGTIAKLEAVEPLPDGRFLVDSVGQQRFKILEIWETDGYKTGKIEFIEDKEEELDEKAFKELKDIANNYLELLSESKETIKERYGEKPTDAPKFTFWLANIIPIKIEYKLELLKMTSVNERLEKLLFYLVNQKFQCNLQ